MHLTPDLQLQQNPEHWLVWIGRLKTLDPARVIGEAGVEGRHPLCVESLDMFVSILGAAAGNLALTGMTTGGVFLGGGIPPRILPKLKEPFIIHAFADKGRFKTLLEKIALRVILNNQTALLGAAACAMEER